MACGCGLQRRVEEKSGCGLQIRVEENRGSNKIMRCIRTIVSLWKASKLKSQLESRQLKAVLLPALARIVECLPEQAKYASSVEDSQLVEERMERVE